MLDTVEHLCHDGNGEENRIPSISLFRQPLQRRWDKCSQIDWRMRLLHRLGINVRLGNVVELSMKFHGVGGPNGLEHLQEFVGKGAAFCDVGAGRFHFIL